MTAHLGGRVRTRLEVGHGGVERQLARRGDHRRVGLEGDAAQHEVLRGAGLADHAERLQGDAAVLLAALGRVVGGDVLHLTEADGAEVGGVEALRDEVGLHRVRTALRQREIVGVRADRVGVAADLELGAGAALQTGDERVEDQLTLRGDLRGVGHEGDAAQHDIAALTAVAVDLGACRGVRALVTAVGHAVTVVVAVHRLDDRRSDGRDGGRGRRRDGAAPRVQQSERRHIVGEVLVAEHLAHVHLAAQLQVGALAGVLGDVGHQAETGLGVEVLVAARVVGVHVADTADQVGVDAVLTLEHAQRVEVEGVEAQAVAGGFTAMAAAVRTELDVPFRGDGLAEGGTEADVILCLAAVVHPDAVDARCDIPAAGIRARVGHAGERERRSGRQTEYDLLHGATPFRVRVVAQQRRRLRSPTPIIAQPALRRRVSPVANEQQGCGESAGLRGISAPRRRGAGPGPRSGCRAAPIHHP